MIKIIADSRRSFRCSLVLLFRNPFRRQVVVRADLQCIDGIRFLALAQFAVGTEFLDRNVELAGNGPEGVAGGIRNRFLRSLG
jgi:hypothetical protein